jgi:hypothetical protein
MIYLFIGAWESSGFPSPLLLQHAVPDDDDDGGRRNGHAVLVLRSLEHKQPRPALPDADLQAPSQATRLGLRPAALRDRHRTHLPDLPFFFLFLIM